SVVSQKLLPQRACAALSEFQGIIQDARSMLVGTFVERVSQTSSPTDVPPLRGSDPSSRHTQGSRPGLPYAAATPLEHGTPDRNANPEPNGDMAQAPPTGQDTDASFDFGANEQQGLFADLPEGEDFSFEFGAGAEDEQTF